MQRAMALAAMLLAYPAAVWSQAPATSGSGHFEGWLSDANWGADKQTFDATFGIRHAVATFTVAQNGFGWEIAFTNSKGTFKSWEDVTAWCSGPGTVLFLAGPNSLRSGIYDLEPADLATIVDGYFKKYVPELERSGRDCTLAGFIGPDPAARARIIELLEAASSEQQ